MPTVQITVPKNDLSNPEKSELIEQLTNSVSRFYRDQKNEEIKDFVNVQINETTSGGYAVGGEVIG